MSELKTLKDLERFEDLKHQDHFIVSSAVLKAEAMKWVKKYGIYNLDEFLNITGEDLKDE